MQGNPRVDELMRPVNAAIRRHVKDAAAVTDIYNRAYEAVMEVQDALNVSAAVTAKQIAENAKNLQRAEKAEARAERYEDALERIAQWAKAYPLDIFPEPDFERVNEVLSAAGISLSCVSASNMRHVITGVARIVEKALKGGGE